MGAQQRVPLGGTLGLGEAFIPRPAFRAFLR
jgi:hypothetical protein